MIVKDTTVPTGGTSAVPADGGEDMQQRRGPRPQRDIAKVNELGAR